MKNNERFYLEVLAVEIKVERIARVSAPIFVSNIFSIIHLSQLHFHYFIFAKQT